jgi:hypothetical protein
LATARRGGLTAALFAAAAAVAVTESKRIADHEHAQGDCQRSQTTANPDSVLHHRFS